MLTQGQYIQKSLETNLFFARIMKEHAFFLEAGFLCKDIDLIQQADGFKNAFTEILKETVCLSNGVISQDAIMSQEFVTNNTLPAEEKTMALSGVQLNPEVTEAELTLVGTAVLNPSIVPQLQNAVSRLNQKAIKWSAALICFKSTVINAVVSCNLFTWNFPLLIEHIRREAVLYNTMLKNLEKGQNPDDPVMAAQLEAFWSKIMAEHALFIQHLLDPTEENLFETATSFAKQFKHLTAEAEAADHNIPAVETVTRRSLAATRSIRDFKKQGTELILMCKIKSLIVPLLGDHVTREANHFIRLLRMLQAAV